MEHDETIARMVAITKEPLQVMGRELKAMADELHAIEQAARRVAGRTSSVAGRDAALLEAAEAKGARMMAEAIAAGIFGAIAKGG